MLTSFTNLPPSLEQKLRRVVSSIVTIVEPEKIICYGARTWLKNKWSSLDPVLSSNMGADYDLLIITDPDKKGRRESEIIDIANNYSKPDTRLITIVRPLPAMNQALEQGWPFFVSMHEHGILLHESSDRPLANPLSCDITAHLNSIQIKFDHYFDLAKKFLDGASHFIASGKAEVAIFMLHQATEHTCTALLITYLGYRPITHNLERLLLLTKNFSGEPANVFSLIRWEEQDLFDTLSRSYLEARYDDNFIEPVEKAKALKSKVKKLQKVILRLYEARVEKLSTGKLKVVSIS